jgi:hypothetical protein
MKILICHERDLFRLGVGRFTHFTNLNLLTGGRQSLLPYLPDKLGNADTAVDGGLAAMYCHSAQRPRRFSVVIHVEMMFRALR